MHLSLGRSGPSFAIVVLITLLGAITQTQAADSPPVNSNSTTTNPHSQQVPTPTSTTIAIIVTGGPTVGDEGLFPSTLPAAIPGSTTDDGFTVVPSSTVALDQSAPTMTEVADGSSWTITFTSGPTLDAGGGIIGGSTLPTTPPTSGASMSIAAGAGEGEGVGAEGASISPSATIAPSATMDEEGSSPASSDGSVSTVRKGDEPSAILSTSGSTLDKGRAAPTASGAKGTQTVGASGPGAVGIGLIVVLFRYLY